MKTRRRSHVKKGTRKKNSKLNQLLGEYNDAMIELETKKRRFKAEYIECQKWRKLHPTFFSLKPKSYVVFNNNESIENKIKEIKADIAKVHKEWIHVHSICEVSYRRHYGLLHTLPPKKMSIIESVYPKIRDEMEISLKRKTRVISKPIIPTKVRFNTVVFKKS